MVRPMKQGLDYFPMDVNYGEVDITSSSCCTKKCLSRKSHLPLNIITVQHRNTMK